MKIKIFLLIACSFFFLLNAFAQKTKDSSGAISQEEALKYKKIADKHFETGDYSIAYEKYSAIINYFKNDPELNYRYGKCIIENNFHKEKSIPYLESAFKVGHIEAIKMLGIAYHEIYKFEEALHFFNLFISKSDTTSKIYRKSGIKRLIENTHSAIDLVKKPVDVTLENLGLMINSKYADYVPIVTADDQEIFFTSKRENSTGGNRDHNSEFYEDIFYAERDSLGRWTQAKNLSDNLNSHQHDAVAGLSADGQTLLIYRNDAYGSGDLYVSYLRESVWTEPKKLNKEISSPGSWEPSATLTPNEDALYFTSDRPGGYGGRDIYVAKRLANGSWGSLQNLGPLINTEYDEDAPFIHADSKTLYFSSKGHKNMGGFDVFKTIKQDKNEWSVPENLGYPINTTDDDIYFTLAANEMHGYYSSHGKDSHGEKDIYMLRFKEREKSLAVLKGKVTDLNEKPLASQIFVNKTSTNKLNGLYNSNALSGKYLIVLQPGFSYRVIFKADKYRNDTLFIDTQSIDSFNEILKNIKLSKINEPIVDTVKADKDTIVLKKKSEQEISLKTVAHHPHHHPIKQVLIDTLGHKQIVTAMALRDKKSKSKPMPIELKEAKQTKSAGNKPVKDCDIDLSDSVQIVNFNYGYKTMELKQEQYMVLDSMLISVKSKLIGIQINAHTDNIGSAKYNLQLSQQRAQIIADQLISKGIASKKIMACFYGESTPIAPNTFENGKDYPAGRYKNRRAEIELFIEP